MGRFTLILFCFCLAFSVLAQKTVHIPNYLQDPNNVDGSQFTWNKTAQSANFILIWGNTVGTDPASYPVPDLNFNPAKILDTLEYIYVEFKELGFLDDAPGTNLSQYKIPVVIYGTWGANGAQGFANGGDADGIIGAFWVHPTAMHDGGVAAHELAHSLQAQAIIDYRNSHGLGAVWLNAGIFWETHANFMRNLLYPQSVSAWGMDVYHLETWGDWKNTYENYEMLMAIKESEGIDMVNRLWRESYSDEYPLQAYKRIAGYSQAAFNDSLYHYARRMATFDFPENNLGHYFRQYRQQDLNGWLPSVQNTWSILKKIPGAEHRYEIPIEQAPEEYAYNVIPLYPDVDSCAVIIKFKGHTEANSHAGWRYGFVAANADGTVSRYSPDYGENTAEINFSLQGAETRLFLVVMGAPHDQITTNPSNDTWHGYPKHFRFPYELSITGAVPEGFQPPAQFRSALKNNGHLHSNGGGWVQNSASVAASVYVGPMAMVLGNSVLSGQVRLENTALVKNATLSNQVKILDNAFVNGGTYSGQAIIRGQGHAEKVTMSGNAVIGMRARVSNYKLSGSIEVGGDVLVYNENGNCNNGVYYRLTNYYDDKLLECDGRTASHPDNLDVNNTYSQFSNADMALQCRCFYENSPVNVDSMQVSPQSCVSASSGSVAFYISNSCGPFTYRWTKGSETGSSLSGLAAGKYAFTITDNLGRETLVLVMIPDEQLIFATLAATPFDCASGVGGSAEVSIQSGMAPFSYSWANGAATAQINQLTPGIYTVTVTDALGCIFTRDVEVPISGKLDAELSTESPSCHGVSDGTASITALNGTAPYTWLWEDGSTTNTLSDIAAGDYAATVSDIYGCKDSLSFSLTEPPALLLSITVNAISCFGASDGSVSVSAGGGTPDYTFQWNTLNTTSSLMDLSVGLYTVTLTDANGCSETTDANIPEPPSLTLSIEGPATLCPAQQGTIAVTAGGGLDPYHFLWSNSAAGTSVDVTGSGTYTATVTDANGCTQMTSFTVADEAPIELFTSHTALLCANSMDGTATAAPLGGNGPYTWQWSNGSTDSLITQLGSGTYSVTLTDVFGCQGEAELSLFSPFPITIIAEDIENITCYGESDGAASITAIGGAGNYSYNWNTGQTTATVTNLPAGYYSITVSDNNGCRDSLALYMVSPPALQLSLQYTPVICPGDSTNLSALVQGGVSPYTFLWNNGFTGYNLNASAGEFSLTVTDANQCSNTQEAIIQESMMPSLEVDLTAASSANSADGSILVTNVTGGQGPYNFEWSNGFSGALLENLEPGNYGLVVTDGHGCTWSFYYGISFSTSIQDNSPDVLKAMVVPNPSFAEAYLNVFSPVAQHIDYNVCDALGRILNTQSAYCNVGENALLLPVFMETGAYWLVLRNEKGERKVLRWVVIR